MLLLVIWHEADGGGDREDSLSGPAVVLDRPCILRHQWWAFLSVPVPPSIAALVLWGLLW